jgi:hypothetical protein
VAKGVGMIERPSPAELLETPDALLTRDGRFVRGICRRPSAAEANE